MPSTEERINIHMKSFDDFWRSIPEDEFVEIADRVNDEVAKMRSETSNPDNLLGNQTAVMITRFTYEILSRYHNWISEQL